MSCQQLVRRGTQESSGLDPVSRFTDFCVGVMATDVDEWWRTFSVKWQITINYQRRDWSQTARYVPLFVSAVFFFFSWNVSLVHLSHSKLRSDGIRISEFFHRRRPDTKRRNTNRLLRLTLRLLIRSEAHIKTTANTFTWKEGGGCHCRGLDDSGGTGEQHKK